MSESLRQPARTLAQIAASVAFGTSLLLAAGYWGNWFQSPEQRAKANAWAKTTPRLDQADRALEESIEPRLKPVEEFFAERTDRDARRAFADDAVSLEGTWALAASVLPFGDAAAHERYISQRFEQRFFQPGELEAVIKGVVAAYLTEIEGEENRLLVSLRADLSDTELLRQGMMPSLESEEQFRREFRRLAETLIPEIAKGLGISVGYFIAGELAGQVAAQVLVAVSTQLGISAGVLGAGAVSSVATFGLGIIVAIVIDQVMKWVLEQTGYDTASLMDAKLAEMFSDMKQHLINGSAAMWGRYRAFLEQAEKAGDARLRDAARGNAEAIAAKGHLGLRFELKRLHELRAQLRRAALKKLILEGGA